MTERLTQIFNALCMVHTKGEDTIIMGQCLSALQQVLEQTQNDAVNSADDEKSTEED